MGRKKKLGGPLKGGGESARANGLVGLLVYVKPEEREEHGLASRQAGFENVRAYVLDALRRRTKKILGKSINR